MVISKKQTFQRNDLSFLKTFPLTNYVGEFWLVKNKGSLLASMTQ